MAEKQFYFLLLISVAAVVAIAGLISWGGGSLSALQDCSTKLGEAAYFDDAKGECQPLEAMYQSVEKGNPATDNCLRQGGIVRMEFDKQGKEYGLCIFVDGTECEQWDLYNGQCPASD